MTRCCVCDATYKKNSNLTFHSFPTDLEVRSSWMKACYIDHTKFKKSMKVCSNHFLVSDYDSTIWPTRKLLKTSVPSPSNRYPKIQMRMQERKPLVQDVNLLIPEKKHKPTISQSISSKDVLETKPSSQISDKGAPQNIEQVTEMHWSTILQAITPVDLLEAGLSTQFLEAPQNIQQDLVPTTIQKTPVKKKFPWCSLCRRFYTSIL